MLFGGRGETYSPNPPWDFTLESNTPRLDTFIMQYDPQVSWCALRLLEHCDYDVVVAYHMQYDDLLHLTEPFSPECLLALEQHVASFERLCSTASSVWAGKRRAFCLAPDHGAHFSEEKQMGWHGTDQPADMELLHFWGLHGG